MDHISVEATFEDAGYEKCIAGRLSIDSMMLATPLSKAEYETLSLFSELPDVVVSNSEPPEYTSLQGLHEEELPFLAYLSRFSSVLLESKGFQTTSKGDQEDASSLSAAYSEDVDDIVL